MKLLVIGPKGHGKDQFCQLLKDNYGLSFRSSSDYANEKAVFPTLSEKYGYTTLHECYADRDNHRIEWRDLIHKYNAGDLSRLVREVLNESDVYCGLRHIDEFNASRHLFDLIVWIDASERLGTDHDESLDIPKEYANIVVYNNGTRDDLLEYVHAFVKTIDKMV